MPVPITVATSRWIPPRGAVALAAASDPATGERWWTARCSCCGWEMAGRVKTAVADEKRFHRCPPGTEGALPRCPVCSSTVRRCYRDSGAGGWHEARRRIYDEATRGPEEA